MEQKQIDLMVRILQQIISEKDANELLIMLANENECPDAFDLHASQLCSSYPNCTTCWKIALTGK